MKRAVITGPTGAVGMALIEYLSGQNIEVTAVCRRNSARKKQIAENSLVKIVECDLEEMEKLPGLIKGKQDVFFHFAWEGTYGNSRNDCDLQNRNVTYTLKAVEAAKQLGCHTFVGAGSQAEYGRFEGALNGKVPAFPETGYGIGKLCAGQMSRLACRQAQIKHVWARILSVYGPYDGPYTMIMSTIEKLLHGETPQLTAGEQKWDYIYSADAARALFLMAEKGKDGMVYCVGSGKIRPLREYIEVMRDCANPAAELGFGRIPYGPGQVFYLQADITDLNRDTGFVPEVSFEEGIRKTIEWYKKEQLL